MSPPNNMNFGHDIPDFSHSSGHAGHSDHHLHSQSMSNSRQSLADSTNWYGLGDQGHMPVGSSVPYGMSISAMSDNLPLLATVTKEDLVRANNFAYISLLNEKMILLSRLEAQNLLVNDLRAIIASNRPAHTASLALCTSEPGPSQRYSSEPSAIVPSSVHPIDIDDNGRLPKTTPPLLYDRVDYPEVIFWTKIVWTDYCKKEEERSRDTSKLGFLTDEEGIPVSKDRMSAMMATARSLFVEIYRARYDPESWRVVGNSAAEYFNNKISAEYVEFRLCDGQWKCQTFATIQYPTWKRDHRGKGKLTRNRPSIQPQKRKLDSESSKSSGKCKEKKRPKSMIPSTSLDSELDNTAGTASLPSNKNATSSRQEEASITPLNLSKDPPTSPAQSTSSSSMPAAATSSLNPQTSESTTSSAHPSNGVLDRQLVARPIPRPLPKRVPQPVGPAVMPSEDQSVHGSIPSQSTASNALGVTPNPEAAAEPSVAPIANHDSNVVARGRRRNVLDNLTIPKPSAEIPYEPPSAAAVENAKKKPIIKGVQPSKALTARNLFMTDYLKDKGPVTAAEFKIVYDSLDEVTQKKYDDLCKHLKAEKRAPKAVDTPQEPAASNTLT